MPKVKLDKATSAKFADFLKLRETAKEASNAVNRQSTVLKNVFKDGIKNKQFLIGTYATFGGFRFDYSQTETDVIEADDFLKLLEEKKITRDQFLKCIGVRKGDVDTHVGSDVSLRLAKPKVGKEFDVRVKPLDIDIPIESMMIMPEVEAPVTRKKVLGKPVVTSQAAAKPAIRRIKIKK